MEIENLLKKYRMVNIEDDGLVDGMRVNRLYGLHTLIKENIKATDVICEIGSYAGISSSLFAHYCKKIYCVDHFLYGAEDYFDNTMKEFSNFEKIKNYSKEASAMFPNNFFDFVYIDAQHTYEDLKEDIFLWKPKLKTGGIIGGHDYNISSFGVIEAVKYFFGKADTVYEDSSWIVKI